MYDLSQQVLRTDAAGMPLEWIGYQDATRLYHQDQVAYSCGSLLYCVRGGFNAITGRRSVIEVSSIIATHGNHQGLFKAREQYTPPLNNAALFRRDAHLCMYCGGHFKESYLTRDHVIPMSRGGKDRWSNVVTACRSCNTHKGNKIPEEAKMALLAIPYVPNWAEYLALSNRKILADQMEFLKSQFTSRPMHFHRKLQ